MLINITIILITLISYSMFLKRLKENFNNLEKINLIFSCDNNQFIGLLAIINSILKNTKNKNRLFFNFLVNKNEKNLLKKLIVRKGLNINYTIKEIKEDLDISNNIRVIEDNNIKNIMNFARFNFAEEFPKLKKIIYLDCDMIVRSPIENLYNLCDTNKYPFHAVSHLSFGNSKDYLPTAFKHFNLNKNAKYFNAGVFCTDLSYWRKNKIKSKIIQYMKDHKLSKKGYFKLGTQPILNIIFMNQKNILPNEWNTSGLTNHRLDKQYLNIPLSF